MNAHAQSQEQREVMVVARRYRRNGYKVSRPDEVAKRPGFLNDLLPDLIAERDDDKVILGIRRASAVRGSNDIVELAERVAAQPGWRFELIAIPETNRTFMPDLTWVREDVQRLLDRDMAKAAFVVVYSSIENMIAYATVARGQNPANVTFSALVRDLVVQGVIDERTRQRIDDAAVQRNMILHAKAEPSPTRGDVDDLLDLGRELQHDILNAATKA